MKNWQAGKCCGFDWSIFSSKCPPVVPPPVRWFSYLLLSPMRQLYLIICCYCCLASPFFSLDWNFMYFVKFLWCHSCLLLPLLAPPLWFCVHSLLSKPPFSSFCPFWAWPTRKILLHTVACTHYDTHRERTYPNSPAASPSELLAARCLLSKHEHGLTL